MYEFHMQRRTGVHESVVVLVLQKNPWARVPSLCKTIIVRQQRLANVGRCEQGRIPSLRVSSCSPAIEFTSIT